MGVRVCLNILPERIDPQGWSEFYDQARQLLAGHSPALATLRREPVGEDHRWVLSRGLECHADDPARRSLRVCGDLGSMKTAERFDLYRDLAHYGLRARTDGSTQTTAPDILSVYLAQGPTATVYSEKTQGYPYHRAVLGVAVLAEALFPGCALASGDLTAAQCEDAVADIAERLGLRVPIPVLVDAERLCAQLVGDDSSSPESLERFAAAFVGPNEAAIRVLVRRAPPAAVLDWLALRLGDGQVNLGLIWLLRDWLNATGDLDGLIEAAALRPGGPRMEPARLAEALVSAGVALDPERVVGLERFDRPAGAPPSVYSYLGNAMLDMMGLAARDCRVRWGTAELLARLQSFFPEQAEICRDIVESGTAKLKQRLAGIGQWADRTGEQSEQDPEQGDGESFVCREPGAPLSPRQDLLLRTLAEALRGHWDSTRAGFAEGIGDDCDPRRLILIRAAEDRNLAPTEAAWAWIDAEDDPELLDLLTVLVLDERRDTFLANLRRGLFEHRDLCERVRGLIAGTAD